MAVSGTRLRRDRPFFAVVMGLGSDSIGADSGGKDEDRQARGAGSDCVTRLGACALIGVLNASADERLRLERNDILFERASTIASRDILRTGPFPSIGEAAPFRDMEVSLAAESERIGAEMRRLTALHDEALSQLQGASLRDIPRKLTALRLPPQNERRAHPYLAAPLSLRLYSTIDRPDRVQRLLSLPPQCTTRWGQVSLFLKKNTFDRELEPDLSSLQRLDAHLRGSTHPERALFMVLSRAPALRTLSLHMLYDRYYGGWQELRGSCLPHLTDLTLSSRGALTNMTFFPMLAQCAGTLERLTLVSEPAWSDANIPTRPIILPHLHTLDLQYTAHKYLFHFDTPASLATRDSCGTHAGALHSLLHLLTASTTLPPITTLLLHRVGAPDPEDFLQCLELLPSLTALHIARAPDDGVPWHVLVRLACTDFRAPLVPRLTAFSLRYARGRVPEKLRRALRVMLRSRAGRKVLRGVDVEALQSVETDLAAGAASEEDTRGDGV
ncbi:hypothetical protein K523DRAFT_374550 [Schizophyllum commune Tattone D]|nr:hypothetical protein K523DRAFT_374550 [Schizophyllum commune Tattone D]